jgi:hypothetical protein
MLRCFRHLELDQAIAPEGFEVRQLDAERLASGLRGAVEGADPFGFAFALGERGFEAEAGGDAAQDLEIVARFV